MGDILADLSQRRAYMESLVRKEGCTIITARSPVATLLGKLSVIPMHIISLVTVMLYNVPKCSIKVRKVENGPGLFCCWWSNQ